MSRLTYKQKNGNWGIKGIPFDSETKKFYGCLCKLKDYEETGLTPDEIEDLKSYVIYLMNELKGIEKPCTK